MLINVEVLVCGFTVNTEIEIDESELEGMDETEREDYIHEQAYEYVKENLEVSCQPIEE